MNLIRDNYLEQMTEELEILEYKLALLRENSVFGEIDLLGQDMYQLYQESLGSTMKSIWNAIIRFIKSIFVSSGEKITGAEAKRIIDIVKSSSKDGKIDQTSKKVAQKAFYLLAGLGTSRDGSGLAEAYRSGNSFDYVMKNISKLNVSAIHDDAEFRICVGAYTEDMDVRYAVIKEVFDTLSKRGSDMYKTEAADQEGQPESFVKQYIVGGKVYRLKIKDDIVGMKIDSEKLHAILDDPVIKADLQKPGDMFYDFERLPKQDWTVNYRNKQLASLHFSAQYLQYLYEVSVHVNRQIEEYRKNPILRRYIDDFGSVAIGKIKTDIVDRILTDKDLPVIVQNPLIKAEFSGETPVLSPKNTWDKSYLNRLKYVRAFTEEYLLKLNTVAEYVHAHDEKIKKIKSTATKVAVGAGVAVALGIIGTVLWKKYSSSDKSKIVFATIAFVNEKKPDGLAKIRLFTKNNMSSIDVKGRDKISGMKDKMLEFAERLQKESEQITKAEEKEKVLTIARCINVFFAGLTDKQK